MQVFELKMKDEQNGQVHACNDYELIEDNEIIGDWIFETIHLKSFSSL